MLIVRNTEGLIKQYLEDFEAGKLRKPERCEHCGRRCNLHWHATYIRTLITLFQKYDRFPIKRLFCPLCEHTFALIPAFIRKFCRYGIDVIASAIREFRKKIKRLKVLDRLAGMMAAVDTYIELTTLYRWKKKYSDII